MGTMPRRTPPTPSSAPSPEVFAAGANLVDYLEGLGFAKLGIDQDGVLVTTDQHRRNRENRRCTGVVHVKGQRRRGRRRMGCKTQHCSAEGETAKGGKSAHG